MIDYSYLKRTLKLLEFQYENHLAINSELVGLTSENVQKVHFPDWVHESVQESVIQRFEICYDCLWKVLKRYLTEHFGLVNVPNSPRGIFRAAFEQNMLPSNIELWFAYVDARIGTSHDYSGEKAQNALSLMEHFVPDTISLYETMTETKWNE